MKSTNEKIEENIQKIELKSTESLHIQKEKRGNAELKPEIKEK
jgi:hypothetical protein